jgi:hypothetical protein
MLLRTRHELVTARVAAHIQLREHLLTDFPGRWGLFHRLDGGKRLTFLTRFPTPRHACWLSESPFICVAFSGNVHAG